MLRDSSSINSYSPRKSTLLHIPAAKTESLAEHTTFSSLVSWMFQWHRITNTCSPRRPDYPGEDYSDKLLLDIITMTYPVLGRWLVQHSASDVLN